jgi:hypothetical protein
MSSSLFKSLGGNSPKLPGPLGNMQQMMSRLNRFRQSFQGDPKQQVQQLLNSGKMTQEQYNRLSQLTTQIQNMITKQ